MKKLALLSINYHSMSSSQANVNDTTITTKNLWCRDARAEYVIGVLGFNPFRQGKGFHIRKCSYGDGCRGAHRLEDIKLLPHINRWNRIDKKSYDFPAMQAHIKEVIAKDKVKLRDINPFNERVAKIEESTFIEIVQLWRELACHYRKIAKEIPRKRDWKSSAAPNPHQSGYVFSDEVPGFYLDDKYEDNAWALDRITRYCGTHQEFKRKVGAKESVIIWDLCLGESNCKEGIHHLDEMLCVDDFLTGKCTCQSKEDFDTYKTGLQDEIETIEDKLTQNLKPKQIEQQKAALARKKSELANFQRKLHYTDCGMIPFEQQVIAYNQKLADEKARAEELLAKVVKPAWDHNMTKGEAKVGKVIKLSLGKK